MLLWPILIPLVASALVLALRKAPAVLRNGVTLLAVTANLVMCVMFFNKNMEYSPENWAGNWGGLNFELALRVYPFSSFVLAAAAGFGFVVTLFCMRSLQGKSYANQFYVYTLITLAAVNGAILANNLAVLLFFWEGMLGTLFAMIAIGNPNAYKTATKAFLIMGVTDLCLMFGIALTGWSAGTMKMSAINLDPTGINAVAMILLMIGAASKAGCMPFHTWIPDAANDAPLPFMALLPASLEKLIGIYLLSRISLDMFKMSPHSGLSTLMMVVGAITIILAVMMALIQKDYKRLLSYHAISQVGYMILGIGTMVPAGIIGGLFHMINHAMYKSCLFLTAGSVEKQAGTTALEKLGGLGRKMPITCACFVVAAMSISGVPPFNGFFSKELVYDGALDRNVLYYLVAIMGSFLTGASFLKLGHAAYFGPRSKENEGVKEAPLSMLVPMLIIAGACVLFGVWNALPIENFIMPGLTGTKFFAAHHAEFGAHMHFAGWPTDMALVVVTLIVLAAAVVNHIIGVRASGSGLHSLDHIHYAPALHGVYDLAEKRWFDPYVLCMKMDYVVKAGNQVDRAFSWIYDRLAVTATFSLTTLIRMAHTGSYSLYVVWALVGAVTAIVVVLLN